MEGIGCALRALASRPRLVIVRSLLVEGEQTVSAIVDGTGMAMNSLSSHLRILAAAGIVWRRRSGGHVYYRLAEEPPNGVVGAALDIVRKTFKADRVVPRVTDERCDREGSVLAAFTAFTHPRRIRIVRYLHENGASVADGLSEALSMSQPAAIRHIEKLWARGIVQKHRVGHSVHIGLAEPMPGEFAEFVSNVLAAVT